MIKKSSLPAGHTRQSRVEGVGSWSECRNGRHWCTPSSLSPTFPLTILGIIGKQHPANRRGIPMKSLRVAATLLLFATTAYVRNIIKYYVAYKLMLDIQGAKKQALEEIRQGG